MTTTRFVVWRIGACTIDVAVVPPRPLVFALCSKDVCRLPRHGRRCPLPSWIGMIYVGAAVAAAVAAGRGIDRYTGYDDKFETQLIV